MQVKKINVLLDIIYQRTFCADSALCTKRRLKHIMIQGGSNMTGTDLIVFTYAICGE
jgi:hypothetical protein